MLRIVVHNGFSLDLADLFFKDLLSSLNDLDADSGNAKISGPSGSGTDLDAVWHLRRGDQRLATSAKCIGSEQL